MNSSTTSAAPRLHPLVVTAAASVTLVSIVGAAAILGVFPSSHAVQATPVQPAMAVAAAPAAVELAAPLQATPTRFQTADGRVFEQVPAQAAQPVEAPAVHKQVKVVHRQVVHPYNTSPAPREVQQASYAEPHPVRTYVSDMSPVGTGVGAVLGGVLGHQVGGGNGKKLATVAGVLLGGYAGNEVAHDRNPLPFSGR